MVELLLLLLLLLAGMAACIVVRTDLWKTGSDKGGSQFDE